MSTQLGERCPRFLPQHLRFFQLLAQPFHDLRRRFRQELLVAQLPLAAFDMFSIRAISLFSRSRSAATSIFFS